MKFLCLVYHDEAALHAWPLDELQALGDESTAYDEELRANGHLIIAHALKPVRTAKSVRRRDGKVRLTDGPFAETKEQLIGFILIEADDREDAIEAAAKIPLARTGTIEVREVGR